MRNEHGQISGEIIILRYPNLINIFYEKSPDATVSQG